MLTQFLIAKILPDLVRNASSLHFYFQILYYFVSRLLMNFIGGEKTKRLQGKIMKGSRPTRPDTSSETFEKVRRGNIFQRDY